MAAAGVRFRCVYILLTCCACVLCCSVDKSNAPDIYAVAFQEIVDLSAQALLVDITDAEAKAWEERIEDALRPLNAHYVQVRAVFACSFVSHCCSWRRCILSVCRSVFTPSGL